MITADRIIIDSDETGFALVILTDDGDKITVNIQNTVIDFYESAKREIGPYVNEALGARAAVRAGVPLPVYNRPISVEDAIDAGYALDDPKSPGYHDRMVD